MPAATIFFLGGEKNLVLWKGGYRRVGGWVRKRQCYGSRQKQHNPTALSRPTIVRSVMTEELNKGPLF